LVETVPLPDPDDAKSDGSQTAGDPKEIAEPTTPLVTLLPGPRELSGLTTENAKLFGSTIAATFARAITNQLSWDLDESRRECKQLREQNGQLSKQLADARVDIATLNAKIDGERELKHTRNLQMVLGVGLIGVALETYKHDLFAITVILSVFGALLLLVGWFGMPGGKRP
jgi:hypothetical protein